MGSGQEWWAHEDRRVLQAAQQEQQERGRRWVTFRGAHKEELLGLFREKRFAALTDRIAALKAEFEAAERVRKGLLTADNRSDTQKMLDLLEAP